MDLKSPVSTLPLVGPSYQTKLERLGIRTIEDLLYHVPSRFLDFRKHTNIANANTGELVTVTGRVVSKTNFVSKSSRKVQIIDIKDDTGVLSLVYFNQYYLLKLFNERQIVFAAGEISWFGKKKCIFNPIYELSNNSVHTGRLVPIYPTTSGITPKWLRGRIDFVLPEVTNQIKDFLTDKEIDAFHTVKLDEAIENAHKPKELENYETSIKRFSLNELIYLELVMTDKKLKWKSKVTKYQLKVSNNDYKNYLELLPFKLTDAQLRCIAEIQNDLTLSHPMNRLLQGDVGSGKTVVAAYGIYISFRNGYSSVLMAPTQIVAEQHFNTLKKLVESTGMKIGLVTSSNQLSNLKNFDVLVGTHSLFYKKDLSQNTAYIIIDEQHKFGVNQREKLVNLLTESDSLPNVLTMTATPIPRTIALSGFGNLELSYLDESPKNRKLITTWIVPEAKRDNSYKWIDEQIEKENIQVYVVCPLIDESDQLQSKAANVEYVKLTNIFSKRRLGLLHGKLKPAEKTKVLNDFRNHKIDILVTTPVIEVGVDVVNATIMVIETADRFGLAQLHQLRGRVGRGKKKSYCLLYSESNSEKTSRRLEIMRTTKSGFVLAEEDLKIRGPGDFFGTLQHGDLKLKFANIADKDQSKGAKDFVEKVKTDSKRFNELVNLAQDKLILS